MFYINSLTSYIYGSPVPTSPVKELGIAIQGKYAIASSHSDGSSNETPKIIRLRQTLEKIKNIKRQSQTDLVEAKAQNEKEDKLNIQSSMFFSTDSPEVIQKPENIECISQIELIEQIKEPKTQNEKEDKQNTENVALLSAHNVEIMQQSENVKCLPLTELIEQINEAKAQNEKEHIETKQSFSYLSSHSLEIMQNREDDYIKSENADFDDSIEFIKKHFELITQAQALYIDNKAAYSKDLETLERDISRNVANAVNAFVQLNLKMPKPDNNKIAKLMDEFELIDETGTEEKKEIMPLIKDETALIGENEFIMVQEEK